MRSSRLLRPARMARNTSQELLRYPQTSGVRTDGQGPPWLRARLVNRHGSQRTQLLQGPSVQYVRQSSTHSRAVRLARGAEQPPNRFVASTARISFGSCEGSRVDVVAEKQWLSWFGLTGQLN